MSFFCGNINPLKIIKRNDTNLKNTNKNRTYISENGIPPFGHFLIPKRKASYAAFLSCGSITVEAAIVMPMLILAFTTLMQVIIFMNIQLKVHSALCRQSVKAAGYSYLVDSLEEYCLGDMEEDYAVIADIVENGVTELLIKNMVISRLGNDFFDTPWIKGGKDGFHVIITPFASQNTIDVILYYELKPAYDFFGVGTLPIIARARLDQWTGTTRVVHAQDNDIEADNGNTVVYVTPSGTVYHTYKDCTYLSVSLTAVKYGEVGSRRNASGGKYYRCPSCCPAVPDAGTAVYISKYGERFHRDKNCHNIYHNIIEIPADEAGGRKWCSKCRTRSGLK